MAEDCRQQTGESSGIRPKAEEWELHIECSVSLAARQTLCIGCADHTHGLMMDDRRQKVRQKRLEGKQGMVILQLSGCGQSKGKPSQRPLLAELQKYHYATSKSKS